MSSTDKNDEDILDIYASFHGIDFPERDIAQSLNTWVPPFCLLIGIVGNIISAVVLRRIYKHILSTCLYLYVCVLADVAILLILCANTWIQQIAALDIKHKAMEYNNSLCKIYPFISDFVLHLSAWMAVAAAIETAIMTVKPQRLLAICSFERARAVILLIIVLLVCLNAHCFWSFALVKIEKSHLKSEMFCTNYNKGNQHSAEFRKIIWPVMFILAADVLPFCIVSVCSVIIISTRVRNNEKVREMDALWRSTSLESDSTKQFYKALIVINIVYIVFMLPKLCYDILEFLVHYEDYTIVSYSLALSSRLELADAVCSLVFYFFISCKIFLLLGCSARFRQECFAIITCQKCCRKGVARQKSIRPNTSQQPLLETPQTVHNKTLPRTHNGDHRDNSCLNRNVANVATRNNIEELHESQSYCLTAV